MYDLVKIRQSLTKRAKQTQSLSMFTSDTALGKLVLSHIYENPEDLDQTGAELDSIGQQLAILYMNRF